MSKVALVIRCGGGFRIGGRINPGGDDLIHVVAFVFLSAYGEGEWQTPPSARIGRLIVGEADWRWQTLGARGKSPDLLTTCSGFATASKPSTPFRARG